MRHEIHEIAHVLPHDLFLLDSCRLMFAIHHGRQALSLSSLFLADVAKLDDGAVLVSAAKRCDAVPDVEEPAIAIDKDLFCFLNGFVMDLVTVDRTLVYWICRAIWVQRVHGLVKRD